jgi:hypothetical protein
VPEREPPRFAASASGAEKWTTSLMIRRMLVFSEEWMIKDVCFNDFGIDFSGVRVARSAAR